MQQRHAVVPVAYLVLMWDSRILLSRRFQTSSWNGWYSLVAGHVETGESYSEWMIREAHEEAGIAIRSEDLQVVHVMHRRNDTPTKLPRLNVFFFCEKWEWEITNMEPDKCDDLSWFSLDALPENTIPYVRHALDMIQKGIGYSEYGWES